MQIKRKSGNKVCSFLRVSIDNCTKIRLYFRFPSRNGKHFRIGEVISILRFLFCFQIVALMFYIKESYFRNNGSTMISQNPERWCPGNSKVDITLGNRKAQLRKHSPSSNVAWVRFPCGLSFSFYTARGFFRIRSRFLLSSKTILRFDLI